MKILEEVFQNAFAIFDVGCFNWMFNLCKLIIMYSRAASNRVGWVGSFSPAKGPFVFSLPPARGCSLAILWVRHRTGAGMSRLPQFGSAEKKMSVSRWLSEFCYV